MRNLHALVIGGTGMLSDVCLYLANEGYSVSVIGRTHSKFKRLQMQSTANSIYPLITDYDTDTVFHEIKAAIEERGSFDLIVSWTPNYSVLERICEMNNGIKSFRLFHIKGSRRFFADDQIEIPFWCEYRKVFLGFIMEGSNSRWLTHEEISNGVFKQIKNDDIEGVIGQIQPYESRPH